MDSGHNEFSTAPAVESPNAGLSESRMRFIGPLNAILLAILFVSVAIFLWQLLSYGVPTNFDERFTLLSNIGIAITCLSLSLLLSRGYVQLVGVLLSAAIWVLITLWMFASDSIFDTSVTGLFLVLVIAGLTLGGRAVTIIGCACILAVVAAFYGPASGEIAASAEAPHPFDLIVLGSTLVTTTVLLRSSAHSTAAAFERVHRNERALYESNHALQREIIARVQAQEALQQRNHELALLNRAGQAFGSSLGLDQVLVTVLDEVRRLLGVTASSVWLIDPESDELVCRQSTGPRSEIVRGWRLAAGDGLVGWAAQHGESLIVPDAQANERHYRDVERQTQWEVRSVLTVPLQVRESVIGVLQVVDKDVDRFKRADLTLLEPLAASAAIAIENARLVEGLEAEVAARTAEILTEKEKSDAILRSVGDAIAVSDLELRIQYVNDAFTVLTGYTAQEILGQHISVLTGHDAAYHAARPLPVALAQGDMLTREVIARRKDGRTYEAALTIAPVLDAEGCVAGFVSSHQDISRIKELERARTRFITNISHQLRTPVTNLKIQAYLLGNGASAEKTELHLQALNDQIDMLNRLVQDILEMAALDSGQALTSWEPILLQATVQTAVTRYQSVAKAAHLVLRAMPLPPELPTVRGDQVRLLQALAELVENAVLFTPAGGQVSVETERTEQDGQFWVRVAVHDDGPGISPEEQGRVFDRFFRGELAESGHIPGTGLGLSIAQEILHAHGGRVTVESDGVPGQGSTFTLWLPASDGEASKGRQLVDGVAQCFVLDAKL